MHKNIFCWLTLAVSFVFASCAPAPVLRLKPLFSETKWIYGKEFARSATDQVEIAVAFENMDVAAIIFDLEIINLSEQPIIVSPEKFYYLPLNWPQDTTGLHAPGKISYAIDPEIRILDLDKEISRENASYATATGIDAVGSLLGLFVAIATIGKEKTEEEIKEEEKRRCDEEVSRQEREIYHANSLANLKNEKVKWESTTLRRTTLEPDQSARGRIYFRANKRAKYLRLCFPIGEANLQIVFEQQKVKA